MDIPIDLPPGLSSRPGVAAELPALHRLICAYEQQVLSEVMIDLEDLEAEWQRPTFDPSRDAVLVYSGDLLVAWCEVYGARRVNACVHPDHWGRGIGSALVDWASRLVVDRGGSTVGQTVPDADAAAAALFRSRGWTALWTSWVLEMPPGQAIAERPVPDGFAVRIFRPGHDEQQAHRVVEDAFGEWPNREPTSYDDWAATVLGRPGFEPWHLLLAVQNDGDSDKVVGVCHLVLSGGTGWVNQLAVAREHRGLGLAQALLAEAFRVARAHDAPRAELSTDSRTGALTLYERLGMRVRWAFTHWAGEPSPSRRD